MARSTRAMSTAEQVRREMRRFEASLPRLMTLYADRWVVFRDGEVVSVRDTEELAYRAGLAKFGRHGGHAEGPLVDVEFAPHPTDVELLAKEGTAWQPVSHRMMIDTGAALTVVEDPVPQFLQLEPIRFQAIAGVTGDLD
jgi:hypothetical protein